MALTAFRGAIAFLTRLPVAADREGWEAFRRAPWTLPLAGYVIGGLVAVPFVAPLPSVTVAFLYLLALVLVTGITHLDGAADLGDAAAVHERERRIEVMTDSSTGVGGLVAVAVIVAGLALAGIGLAGLSPAAAVGIVVAAEVSAKLGMATIACLGAAPHEGLGSSLTEEAEPRTLLGPTALALPAAALTWPSPAAAVALAAGFCAALVVLAWATDRLGGTSGDAFGAANELARVVALHAGVVAWTLF